MFAVKTRLEAVSTAGSSLTCEHVLHVFPSFGIGGVPLRMVRIINHFGKRLRHTVIALDNNFDAAAGISGDLDATMLAGARCQTGCAAQLGRRDLWRCAACDRISCSPIIGGRSNGRRPAGSRRFPGICIWKPASAWARRIRRSRAGCCFGDGRSPAANSSSFPRANSRIWHAAFGGCLFRASPISQTVSIPRVSPPRFLMACPALPAGQAKWSSAQSPRCVWKRISGVCSAFSPCSNSRIPCV